MLQLYRTYANCKFVAFGRASMPRKLRFSRRLIICCTVRVSKTVLRRCCAIPMDYRDRSSIAGTVHFRFQFRTFICRFVSRVYNACNLLHSNPTNYGTNHVLCPFAGHAPGRYQCTREVDEPLPLIRRGESSHRVRQMQRVEITRDQGRTARGRQGRIHLARCDDHLGEIAAHRATLARSGAGRIPQSTRMRRIVWLEEAQHDLAEIDVLLVTVAGTDMASRVLNRIMTRASVLDTYPAQ